MNNTETRTMYEAPKVEVIEVKVERGFTVSDVAVGGWGDGGHLGDYELE